MSEPEKGNLKDSKPSHTQGLGAYIASSAWRVVPLFAFVGFILSHQFKLTMNKDVWFWFFSSIAQTFAALVALVAIFIISRLEFYNATMNSNIQMMRSLIPEFQAEWKSVYLADERVKDITDRIIERFREGKGKIIMPDNGFLLINARADFNKLEQKTKQVKNQMEKLLENTLIIIMLSIFLIPFGSVNTVDSWMLALWNDLNLKWAFIFGVVGFCIASLYKVGSILDEILF